METDGINIGTNEILLIAALVVVVVLRMVPFFKRFVWLRYITLAFGLGVFGFWLSRPLSLVNFSQFFTGSLPAFETHLYIYILVCGVVGLALILGKNIWCFWICPFNAMQEVAHNIGGRKVRPIGKLQLRLRNARYVILWIVLLLVLVLQKPAISVFEPWGTIFSQRGSIIQWTLVGASLGMAIVVYDFWCHYMCPVGAVMDFVLGFRRWIVGIIGRIASVAGIKMKLETNKYDDIIANKRESKDGNFIWSRDKCTGCARCADKCPVDAISLNRDKSAITKKINIAPCSRACPAGIDASRYVRLIGEGKYSEALAVIREKIPLPSVCGYVCLHPCETECQRGRRDEAILIRSLKRFAAEHGNGLWKKNLKETKATGKKVAIVGSGPAGLSAGYYLARKGHGVTIYEASSEKGGKLLSSIPSYELPKDILAAEIKEIEEIGVDIKTNKRIASSNELFKQGYQAVLIAVGTGKGLKLPVPGADHKAVLRGETLLREAAKGKELKLGNKVVVLGGGDTAFKCALKALEQGAGEVHMFGMEHQGGGQADPFDIDQALAGGVITHSWLTFVHVASDNGTVKGVEALKIRAFGFDKNGQAEYEPIKGTEEMIPADAVISAIGTDTAEAGSDIFVAEHEGVFVAGDAVNEQRSTIDSIAAARWAATEIDKYLGGNGNIEEVLAPPVEEEIEKPLKNAGLGLRRKVPTEMRFEEQKGGLTEIEHTIKAGEAAKEAKRCLRCDLAYNVDHYSLNTLTCTYCGRCVDACAWDAIGNIRDMKGEATVKDKARKGIIGRVVLPVGVAVVSIIVLAIVFSGLGD